MPDSSGRLRILTWHVHGNYLWYLTQVPHEFYLVTDAARSHPPHRPQRHAAVGRQRARSADRRRCATWSST